MHRNDVFALALLSMLSIFCGGILMGVGLLSGRTVAAMVGAGMLLVPPFVWIIALFATLVSELFKDL